MTFDNFEISIDELPTVDKVSWSGMDTNFTRRLLVRSSLALIIVAAGVGGLQLILSTAIPDVYLGLIFGWLWLLFMLLAFSIFLWPVIAVPRMGYALREKDVIYKSGVLWHTVTAIPFNRVQHVEKTSTPLDRRYGLASLQLYTAGGSGGDLKVHGLPADTAESLRIYILEKVGSSIERR